MANEATGGRSDSVAARQPIEPGAFQSARQSTPAPAQRRAPELHVCPCCCSNLVYPTDWAPAGTDDWGVDLRCPECEWRGSGVFDQDAVDRFDEELDRGMDSLLADLSIVTRANMEEEGARFLAALTADQVLPEDF